MMFFDYDLEEPDPNKLFFNLYWYRYLQFLGVIRIRTKGIQIRNIAFLDITMTTFYPRHSFSRKKYRFLRV